MSFFRYTALVAILLLYGIVTTHANDFKNADFNKGLDGWYVEGGSLVCLGRVCKIAAPEKSG
jgi:hypothetical protein